MWLYNLALYITKIVEEDFCSSKKCVRLLTYSDYCEHTSPIFKSLNILKLLAVYYNY